MLGIESTCFVPRRPPSRKEEGRALRRKKNKNRQARRELRTKN